MKLDMVLDWHCLSPQKDNVSSGKRTCCWSLFYAAYLTYTVSWHLSHYHCKLLIQKKRDHGPASLVFSFSSKQETVPVDHQSVRSSSFRVSHLLCQYWPQKQFCRSYPRMCYDSYHYLFQVSLETAMPLPSCHPALFKTDFLIRAYTWTLPLASKFLFLCYILLLIRPPILPISIWKKYPVFFLPLDGTLLFLCRHSKHQELFLCTSRFFFPLFSHHPT